MRPEERVCEGGEVKERNTSKRRDQIRLIVEKDVTPANNAETQRNVRSFRERPEVEREGEIERQM